jgi:hypothetical protein
MFEKIIENSAFPGIDAKINMRILVPEVKFIGNDMTVQFVIELPGNARIPLKNSEATFPIPPGLKAALGQVFNGMVEPMIAKMNADYAAQIAEQERLRAEVAKSMKTPASHDS